MLPQLTMDGRLTADPTLRFTQAGVAVCGFTLACNDRKRNDGGQWEDVGDPLFVRVTAWRDLAENCAESLAKGDLVVVTGKLSTRKWENKDGVEQTSVELDARTVASSLQFRTIKHAAPHRQRQGDDPYADVPPPDEEPPPF